MPMEKAVRTAVRQALSDPGLGGAVALTVDEKVAAKARAFPDEDTRRRWTAEARRARLYALQHLPDLIEQFCQVAESHGVKVHVAPTARVARETILAIIRQHGVRLVAKAKSMTSEEIRLNPFLAEAGVEVVETDLRERIAQLAGEPPSHIISPVIHKTREAIAQTIRERTGWTVATDTASLAAAMRSQLRGVFGAAELGITGANFLVAESGSAVLVSNEGNARMVSTLPRLHVVLAGLEKIVASWGDLVAVLRVLAPHATGQILTAYVSAVTRPRQPDELDGPEELHVILLDNGRSRILGSAYEEVLLCIRCGACLNVCPVFRQVSGLGYLSPYSGPIGAVLTPLLEGLPVRGELPFLSSLCGACYEACPVGIRLHEHLLTLRRDAVAAGFGWPGDKRWLRLLRRAWSTPRRYRLTAQALRLLWRTRTAAWLPPLATWRRGRTLPRPALRHQRYAERTTP